MSARATPTAMNIAIPLMTLTAASLVPRLDAAVPGARPLTVLRVTDRPVFALGRAVCGAVVRLGTRARGENQRGEDGGEETHDEPDVAEYRQIAEAA